MKNLNKIFDYIMWVGIVFFVVSMLIDITLDFTNLGETMSATKISLLRVYFTIGICMLLITFDSLKSSICDKKNTHFQCINKERIGENNND